MGLWEIPKCTVNSLVQTHQTGYTEKDNDKCWQGCGFSQLLVTETSIWWAGSGTRGVHSSSVRTTELSPCHWTIPSPSTARRGQQNENNDHNP